MKEQQEAPVHVTAGLDECGVGSAAFVVVAGCVVLDPARPIPDLADSKTLGAGRREEFSERIKANALAWSIATASLEEIEELNILKATHLAMARAVADLRCKPARVLVDGNRLPDLGVPAEAIVGGDAKIPVISAASIIAKVARDEMMRQCHLLYPQYGFDKHKGYLTEGHMKALQKFGPCPIHRKTYAPIKELIESGRFAIQRK